MHGESLYIQDKVQKKSFIMAFLELPYSTTVRSTNIRFALFTTTVVPANGAAF